jgi:hypothetical protein
MDYCRYIVKFFSSGWKVRSQRISIDMSERSKRIITERMLNVLYRNRLLISFPCSLPTSNAVEWIVWLLDNCIWDEFSTTIHWNKVTTKIIFDQSIEVEYRKNSIRNCFRRQWLVDCSIVSNVWKSRQLFEWVVRLPSGRKLNIESRTVDWLHRTQDNRDTLKILEGHHSWHTRSFPILISSYCEQSVHRSSIIRLN